MLAALLYTGKRPQKHTHTPTLMPYYLEQAELKNTEPNPDQMVEIIILDIYVLVVASAILQFSFFSFNVKFMKLKC